MDLATDRVAKAARRKPEVILRISDKNKHCRRKAIHSDSAHTRWSAADA
jgi:hypothetical protein